MYIYIYIYVYIVQVIHKIKFVNIYIRNVHMCMRLMSIFVALINSVDIYKACLRIKHRFSKHSPEIQWIFIPLLKSVGTVRHQRLLRSSLSSPLCGAISGSDVPALNCPRLRSFLTGFPEQVLQHED